MRRARQEAATDKRQAIRDAEAAGEVADSRAVRLAIVERMMRGEITLEQAQAEIKANKRGAKAAGKTTRSKVWRNA